jgi:hypothetical protein
VKEHSGGGGIGRSLAKVLADTIVHSRAASVDHEQAAKWRGNTAAMEHAETIYGPMLRGVVDELLSHPELPDSWRPALSALVEPEHQWNVLLQLIALPSVIIQAVFSLGTPILRDLQNSLNATYTSTVIPPADLADMVERNIVGQGWAEGEAAKSGVNAERFALMVKDTGEPYGIEQALSLYRRGIIDEGRFTEILYYSRVRNEFLPDVLALAHSTMTPGDAIELALKQITDTATARDYFAKGGGLPEQFDLLVQGAGNPIGPEAAVNLWAHGVIDDAQLQQVIAHSRINPMFYELAKDTHRKWLSVIQIELALKAGTVSPEDAAAWLAADGYDPAQIGPFVSAAHQGKTAAHKQLTESQVTQLYESGFFTHDQATAELGSLGYDQGEVDFILAVYEQRRKLTIMQAGVTRVGKAFQLGRIDRNTASGLLDELGIDPHARDDYLALWTVEKQTELKELTMAQVGGLYKKGLIDDGGALARWQAMGYSADDAALLLANYGGTPPPGSPAAAGLPSQPAAPGTAGG